MTDTKPAPSPENPFSCLAERLNLDDTRAAGLLGVPVFTWRKWATGQRTPSAAALRLLDLLAILETLAPDMLATLIPPASDPKRPRGRAPAGEKSPL